MIAFVVSAPNAIEQRVSGPCPAGFRREQFENLKLERRQIDARSVADDFMTSFVDHKVADFDPFAVLFGGRSSAASNKASTRYSSSRGLKGFAR